ncbi:MAG: hypothetical protein DRH37_00945 [Deltaproteobacteria bacterium]|nr:MAG: hypothetical protein DRH37_00945 [Deltaproteobacteria bacterium]
MLCALPECRPFLTTTAGQKTRSGAGRLSRLPTNGYPRRFRIAVVIPEPEENHGAFFNTNTLFSAFVFVNGNPFHFSISFDVRNHLKNLEKARVCLIMKTRYLTFMKNDQLFLTASKLALFIG